MDLQKIKALIDLVADSKLSELELREGECRLRVVRGGGAQATGAVPQGRSVPVVSSPRAVSTGTPSAAAGASATPPAAERKLVKAPMFGIYHAAPSPSEAPFVKVGDPVSKGQKLCMLEAMKLFHAMTSPHDGAIKTILVENGQEVDAGMPLFEIE